MELLIDELIERESTLTQVQFQAIHAAMDAMGLGDADRVRYLAERCLR